MKAEVAHAERGSDDDDDYDGVYINALAEKTSTYEHEKAEVALAAIMPLPLVGAPCITRIVLPVEALFLYTPQL